MIKKFSIAVDESLINALSELSEQTERSKNWLINKAIEEYIIKHDKYMSAREELKGRKYND